MLYRTEGYSEVGGLRDKVDRRVEQRRQSHAGRAEQQGSNLVAYKADDDVESLHAAEYSSIFQHMSVAVFTFVFIHLRYRTAELGKYCLL